MVDESLIREKFSGEDLDAIIENFKFLRKVGVFRLFIEQNKNRIVGSFEATDEETLAKQLREVRQENKVLTALDSLFTTA